MLFRSKKRGLIRKMGHKAGADTLEKISRCAQSLGVKHLTVYAFSTENWKRPKLEVDALMNLLVTYLKNEIDELHKNNVKLTAVGDFEKLPEACVKELHSAMDKTKDNTGVHLNLALNYGGRNDIREAVVEIAKEYKEGKISLEDITEERIKKHLSTGEIPDPDLVIRTSGEQRLSNFLLWDIAYSEFYYTDIHWPDFDGEALEKAIYAYQKRDRRFGGVK